MKSFITIQSARNVGTLYAAKVFDVVTNTGQIYEECTLNPTNGFDVVLHGNVVNLPMYTILGVRTRSV